MDVDGGCSLEEVPRVFEGYEVLVYTTRNHQKIKHPGEKNEQPACDRFRVVIPLDQTIVDIKTYQCTWRAAKERWPFIDKQCKDPARFYFSSQKQVFKGVGEKFKVVRVEAAESSDKKHENISSKKDPNGNLKDRTIHFVSTGSIIESWHDELIRAASDLRICGFNHGQAVKVLSMASLTHEGQLNEKDLGQIKDIFSREKVYHFSDESDWPKPVPIEEYATESVNPGIFPGPLNQFIKQQSDFCETPTELCSLAVLGVASMALTGKYRVEPKDGFTQPLNLYLMTALESGNRKSSILDCATKPLIDWEFRMAQEYGPQIQKANIERQNQEAVLKGLRLRLAKEKTAFKRSEIRDEIINLENNKPEVPTVPRLVVADVTPERLASILSEQGECIGIFSDEGGFFELIGGRYNNGISNLDVYLKGFDGSACRVDRQTGNTQSIRLHEPLIATMLSPQPSVLRSLALKPEFRDRGLVARFLFALPNSPIGQRTGEVNPIPHRIIKEYGRLIDKLLKIPTENTGNGSRGRLIKFSADAKTLWKEYWQKIESKMKEGGSLDHLTDWGSKLPAKVARIAGIFAVIRSVDSDLENVTVYAEDLLRAISLADVLESHTLKAFHLMSADPNTKAALRVLQWIKDNALSNFTRRDCHNRLQSHFKTVEPLKRALQVLVEHHYIKPKKEAKVAHRPSEKYEVNPAILNQR